MDFTRVAATIRTRHQDLLAVGIHEPTANDALCSSGRYIVLVLLNVMVSLVAISCSCNDCQADRFHHDVFVVHQIGL